MSKSLLAALFFVFSVSLALIIFVQRHDANVVLPSDMSADSALTSTGSKAIDRANVVSDSNTDSEALEGRSERGLFYLEGDPYPFSVAGYRYALNEIERNFEQHYPKYLQGLADSTYVMSVIARHCASLPIFEPQAGEYKLEELKDRLKSEFNQRPASSDEDIEFLQYHENVATALVPTCVNFMRAMSSQSRQPYQIQLKLLKDAAEAGHVIAKLELLDGYIKPDIRNYQESAKLLEEIINTRSPRAYQEAIAFFVRFRTEYHQREKGSKVVEWTVAACRKNKLCRLSVLAETLSYAVDPIELHELYQRVENLENKISKGERIGFANYRPISSFLRETESENAEYVTREQITWETEF